MGSHKAFVTIVFIAVSIYSVSGAAHATDIYVQQGSTVAPAGTKAAPYTSIYAAVQAASANLAGLSPTAPPQHQIIHLETPIGSPGYYGNFAVQYSGKSNGYIVIVGSSSTSDRVKVVGDGGHFGVQVAGVAYVAIQNLDVSAPGPWSAIFVDVHSHHVQVTGNVTHDSGFCGISTYEADYLTISYNTVYNNAGYYSSSMSPRITCSGISTAENTDIDSYTGIKSVINGNIVYNNSNYNSSCTGSCGDADGSGIIVDDSAHDHTDNHPYGGTTLVTNNIVVGNGGRGIYMFQSDHIIVENNTCYYNNLDPQESAYIPGEIEVYGLGDGAAGGGGDISIYNNIAFSDGRPAAYQPPYTHNGDHDAITVQHAGNDGKGGVTVDYNMVYATINMPTSLYGSASNNTDVIFGSHNMTANPLFVNASTNPTTAVFSLQSTSPALRAGAASYAACYDLDSVLRPSTSVICDPTGLTYQYDVDLGAFQQTTH